MPAKQTSHWFGRFMKASAVIVLCLISAIIGGAFPSLTRTGPHTLQYSDFISIMLTAISVLMTGLAMFLAVAGFVGWTTIEQKVHGKTEEIIKRGLDKGGNLDLMIRETVRSKAQEMYDGVETVTDEHQNRHD